METWLIWLLSIAGGLVYLIIGFITNFFMEDNRYNIDGVQLLIVLFWPLSVLTMSVKFIAEKIYDRF